MSINERSRHELYVGLEEVLGRERADTMMALLPPVGWAEVATKYDVDALRVATKHDLEVLGNAMKQDIELVRVELEGMRATFDTKLELLGKSIEANVAAQHRALVLVLVSLMLAINGVGVALAGLLG